MAENDKQASRRDFLKLAGTATPAAAAASLVGGAASAETAQEAGAGLRATEHTEAYLASARF